MLRMNKAYAIILIFLFLGFSVIGYLYYEEKFRFIIALALILSSLIIFWLIRLFLLKLQDHPAAGINLKLSLTFILLSALPLSLVLYFSNQIINRFIEEKLEQPFGSRIESIRELSMQKIYDNEFITYVNSDEFRDNLSQLIKYKKNVILPDSIIHFIVSLKEDNMQFLFISQNRILKFYEKKSNFKEELFKLLKKIMEEEHKNLNDNVELVLIETDLNLLFHIKKNLQDNQSYILTGHYIGDTDLKMATKIKELSFIYEGNKLTKEQAVLDFNKIIIIIGLPTLIISVILSFIFAKNILKPVERLISGTKEIAKGNLNYKILEKDKGDFGELIKSFNNMSEELIKNKNQLYRIEKIAAWREVARKLAHEIKNPLTPIKLAAERIQRQYNQSNPNFSNILNDGTTIIINEVDRLRKLVNEFSDFARLPKIDKTNNVLLNDINEIKIYYMNTYNKLKFNSKEILIDNNFMLRYDHEKIKQVLINIIDNSIESNNDSDDILITFKVEKSESEVIISISDDGIGIKQQDIEFIFDPYFTKKKEGNGLGLAIVKNIIEEHNGRIEVNSVYNEGAAFTIYLPL